jgi:hypothetical protein
MMTTPASAIKDEVRESSDSCWCLHCRLDCYRVERTISRAGVAPAEVQRLSRRTVHGSVLGRK